MIFCRWNDLITENPTLHAQLTLDFEPTSKTQHFYKFKYQKLNVFRINYGCETANAKQQRELFFRNKENIKEVKISCSFWLFVENLRELPNLVKLSLDDIKFVPVARKLSIPTLEHLQIDCSPDILDVPNLKKLNYTGKSLPTMFLETCKNLTHLTFGRKSEDDNPSEFGAISQHLLFLKVCAGEKTSLIPLLNSQKDSLKELEMESNKHGEVEFAINSMKLEKLSIWIPDELKALSKNSTIKKINLKRAGFGSITKANTLSAVMAVEKIIIDLKSQGKHADAEWASNCVVMLNNQIANDEYKGPPIDFFKTFDSIEAIDFTLHRYSNMTAHLKLLANCSTLKKLKIEWKSDNIIKDDVEPIASNELQRILDNVPVLEELVTTQIFLLSDDVIEVLLNSKIRTLKITVFEDVFAEQQKFAVKLSKQGNIRCTVFSLKRVQDMYEMMKQYLSTPDNNDDEDDDDYWF